MRCIPSHGSNFQKFQKSFKSFVLIWQPAEVSNSRFDSHPSGHLSAIKIYASGQEYGGLVLECFEVQRGEGNLGDCGR